MPSQQAFLKELSNLETILKKFKYWGPDKPEFDLADISTPFGVGKISLFQWLQYLYMPKMREIAEANMPMPMAEIGPYAEEVLEGEGEGAEDIITVIRRLDTITSD